MPDSNDVYLTWRQLAEKIADMPDERKDDPVQILPPEDHEEPIPLHCVYGFEAISSIATVVSDTETHLIPNFSRSVNDNSYHPEHYVLLADYNSYDEYGNQSYTITEDGFIGDNTGIEYEFRDGG